MTSSLSTYKEGAAVVAVHYQWVVDNEVPLPPRRPRKYLKVVRHGLKKF